MRFLQSYKISCLLILFFVIPLICYADEPRIRPHNWAIPVLSDCLENWYKVDDIVYRSAQPDKEGFADIEKIGIKRILNLREFHTDEDEAEKSDVELFHIPMNAAKIKDEDVIEALALITSSKDPVLLHCWHGADRTGTVIAMYRIVIQKWSKSSAIDELVNGGYGYHSIYDNIIQYINNADVEKVRQQVVLQ